MRAIFLGLVLVAAVGGFLLLRGGARPQKAQDRYNEELVVVGIHRTDTEKPSTGLEFAKARGVSYLLVADSNGSLYQAVGGFGMPVAVFIDKEGIVQEIKSGPKTTEEMEEKIARIVVHTPPVVGGSE